MGINGVCPACGGKQHRGGYSAGGQYLRMRCKTCGKAEYIPTENRRVLTLQEVIERAKAGGLKVWIEGKLHEVNGNEG